MNDNLVGNQNNIDEFSKNDLLQFALREGIIDLTYVQTRMEMSSRKRILEQHPYKIWQGKDGFWRTYLPDEEKGRKLVKKKAQRAVEDVVVAYSREHEKKESIKSFDDVYHLWREVQDELVSDNSTVKYDTDYLRYFKDANFASKHIKSITQSDIKVFICKTVKEKHLCKKACKTLFGYVHNTIDYAYEKHMISDNPVETLKAKQFYQYCTESGKTIEQKTVSDEQMLKLYGQFQDDYKNKPWYIPTYAVHFATLTGMRVGEISALKWDCIKDGYIVIDKSEKYNRKTKVYYIDKTKTGKERKFPITSEIKALLEAVKRVQIEYGYICEWVFANEDGRIHAPSISSCSKNKCRQVGIDDKGIHAYRKTLNSKLRCNGVSATVAASLLGHSEEVNEESYTFDLVPMEDKEKMVSVINRKVG